MTIKKQFVEIFDLLEANKKKQVGTMLPQLLELMQRKNNLSGQANTYHMDSADKVVAIFCYYHKAWELVSEVEYGSKKNTATGLNTMCKEGVSAWTKQQRVKKQAGTDILERVAAGKLPVDKIGEAQKLIIEESAVVTPRKDDHGFLTLEAALEAKELLDAEDAEEAEIVDADVDMPEEADESEDEAE